MSVDPELAEDLDLTDMTPEAIYNGGSDIAGLSQDMRGVDRLPGLFSIGAYERD